MVLTRIFVCSLISLSTAWLGHLGLGDLFMWRMMTIRYIYYLATLAVKGSLPLLTFSWNKSWIKLVSPRPKTERRRNLNADRTLQRTWKVSSNVHFSGLYIGRKKRCDVYTLADRLHRCRDSMAIYRLAQGIKTFLHRTVSNPVWDLMAWKMTRMLIHCMQNRAGVTLS